MYNHNKAQQSKNRVHIYWDILYMESLCDVSSYFRFMNQKTIWYGEIHQFRHNELQNITKLFHVVTISLV